MQTYLQHNGLVTDFSNGKVKITLTEVSGCSSCHNSLCMLGESKAKQIEVPSKDRIFSMGDSVIVRIKPSSGYLALFLLYLFPFGLMMAAMVVLLNLNYNEGIAGLSALLILVPYYGALYLSQKYFQKQCEFEVVKSNEAQVSSVIAREERPKQSDYGHNKSGLLRYRSQ
jgi:positive regulator of sigma E activity